MKEFVIGHRQEGQRLDKYLCKVLDRAPQSFIYKMLRKKNIVLNGRKASGSEKLAASDVVRIWLSDETFAKFSTAAGERVKKPENTAKTAQEQIPENTAKTAQIQMLENTVKAMQVRTSENTAKSMQARTPEAAAKSVQRKTDLQVVYEDGDILIVNKPAGVLSQKAKESDYSMNERIIDYLLTGGQLTERDLIDFRPSVCNRLDRNTSGLLLAGKSVRGLQELSALLQTRDLKKYYRCIAAGNLTKEQYLKGYLTKDTRKNKSCITAAPFDKNSRPIETYIRPLEQFADACYLEIDLLTGRSHQIRAHLASIGHPLIGDVKYGGPVPALDLQDGVPNAGSDLGGRGRGHAADTVRRPLLHAYRMEFPDGRVYTADLPQDFAAVLQAYRS